MRRTTTTTALALALGMLFPARAFAADYYVTTTGKDVAAGSQQAPWATLQHAADTVAPGDTVHVAAGSYTGFYLGTSGTANARIAFLASPGVTIDHDNGKTPDGINLEGASYVTVDGFTVNARTRAGIRAVTANYVTISNNKADQIGRAHV